MLNPNRTRPLDGNTKHAVFSRGKPIYPHGSPNPMGANGKMVKTHDLGTPPADWKKRPDVIKLEPPVKPTPYPKKPTAPMGPGNPTMKPSKPRLPKKPMIVKQPIPMNKMKPPAKKLGMANAAKRKLLGG